MIDKENNILIAGSNGIIGKYLSSYLKGKFVLEYLSLSKNSSLCNYFQIDLNDKRKVIQFIKKTNRYKAIVFLVGLAHKKGFSKDMDEFEKVNFRTLFNLLSIFDKYDKIPGKIIFASTISVYGENYDQFIFNENILCDPSTPYAITKLKAEEYLLKKYINKAWILRFSPVYSSDFTLNIYRRIKFWKVFYRIGSGEIKLSLCNIKNIGLTVENILNNTIPCGIYNLSDSKIYSYNDLLKWGNVEYFIKIPKVFIKIVYKLGVLFNNIFIKENSIKLLSNSIYPSNKITRYVNLPYFLKK